MKMPCYVARPSHRVFGGSTLSGFNVPVRVGNVTVMPGDLAFGDKEGVSFIPPIAWPRASSITPTKFTFTTSGRKMKFDEGKYKSSDIYSSVPKTPRFKRNIRNISRRSWMN